MAGNKKEDCYWYSEGKDNLLYCRFHKIYSSCCIKDCENFFSKELADGAMRIVCYRRNRKK